MALKETLRLTVDPAALEDAASIEALHRGAAILRSGGTVAFATETVYGLGANALDPLAVQAIFVAKQRPGWDPLIVHLAAAAQLLRVTTDVPQSARLLMERFWPGPLTLLLPRSPEVPDIVTAGRPRVGVRVPDHPVARRLLELADVPVAAPSANSFGRTSPTRAEYVLDDLDGRIDAVIDSGETSLGLESTVVDACEDPPVLYRPGMITLQQLQGVCPSLVTYLPVSDDAEAPASLPSPGISLKHYAPKARMILLNDAAELTRLGVLQEAAGERVGIMAPDDWDGGGNFLVYRWGKLTEDRVLARRLFAGLRYLDAAGATVILCPLPPGQGLGVALRDRLVKAAR